MKAVRGLSSVGRALPLQGRCQEFESPRLHNLSNLAPLDISDVVQNNRRMAIEGQTATFSDLLRSPNDVVAATANGDVLLTRRDGDDLVLSSAEAERRNRGGLEFAASVVSAAVADWPGSFAHRLHQPFPWMTFLSEREQEEFAAELVDVARACASVGRFEQLALNIYQWKSTASAYADGLGRDSGAIDWIVNPEVAERPS